MSIKVRDFDLEVKSIDSDGTFSGYGSVFGNLDFDKEVMAEGCFADCLAERSAKGRKIPVLWQHQTNRPLGVYTNVEEDEKGLYVEGKLLTKEVALAKEAYALMKAGAVTGLSIGFWPKESKFDQETGVRTWTRVDVDEVSLVTFPANDSARVEAVKYRLAHGGLPSLSEFEKLLRDAGFSRTQAATVASHGLKHLLRDAEDPATETAAHDLLRSLEGFSLPRL